MSFVMDKSKSKKETDFIYLFSTHTKLVVDAKNSNIG